MTEKEMNEVIAKWCGFTIKPLIGPSGFPYETGTRLVYPDGAEVECNHIDFFGPQGMTHLFNPEWGPVGKLEEKIGTYERYTLLIQWIYESFVLKKELPQVALATAIFKAIQEAK